LKNTKKNHTTFVLIFLKYHLHSNHQKHPIAAKRMRERRRFERFGLSLDARLEANDGDRHGPNPGFLTTNISAGGAYFTTPEPLTQGVEVRMEIILPFNSLKKVRVDKDACLMISGKVVRTEAAGIAVQFNDDCSIMPVN